MPRPHEPSEPQCSIQVLSTLVTALDAWGADVDAVLARAGLERAQLDDRDLRIGHSQFEASWAAARDLTGDPAIGLHVVSHLELSGLDLLAYLASASSSGREAFERASRYARLAYDVLELRLQVEDGRAICTTRFRGREHDRSIAEAAVGLIIKLAPRVIGQPADVVACFTHAAPDYAHEYHRVLQVPVRFDAPYDGIIGDSASLDDPIPRADPGLAALLEDHAQSQLARVPDSSDFADRVRARIAAALPGGDPSAEGVASSLGLSARSLRRHLRACGTTHQRLLDEVRCELARRSLARPGSRVAEVAFSLGFSDASAFHKAFRRWTGRRPGVLRSSD